MTDGEGVAITGCSDDIANEPLVEKDSVALELAEPTSEDTMVGDGGSNMKVV